MRSAFLIAVFATSSAFANCTLTPDMSNEEIRACADKSVGNASQSRAKKQKTPENQTLRTSPTSNSYSTTPTQVVTSQPAPLSLQEPSPLSQSTTPVQRPIVRHDALNDGAKGLVAGIGMGVIAGLATLAWAVVGYLKRRIVPKIKTGVTAGVATVSDAAKEFHDRNKKCPFCAETIKREAVVCKHCHRSL